VYISDLAGGGAEERAVSPRPALTARRFASQRATCYDGAKRRHRGQWASDGPDRHLSDPLLLNFGAFSRCSPAGHGKRGRLTIVLLAAIIAWQSFRRSSRYPAGGDAT
jgi:hypothetical protein